jgi:hypothetical protein
VEEILTSSHVYVPKVVLAELMQGAKSEKEISVIEEFLEAFTIVDQTDDTWLGAGKLSFLMKRKGLTAHLIAISPCWQTNTSADFFLWMCISRLSRNFWISGW